MSAKIVQMVGRMLVGMAVVNLAAYAGDVARVYVVRPSSGVTTYLVDDANAWRLEGTFFSRNDLRCKRPIALVRAGPFFYALDQYEDSQLGYFSISRYDAKGAYRGKLVEKCTLTSLHTTRERTLLALPLFFHMNRSTGIGISPCCQSREARERDRRF